MGNFKSYQDLVVWQKAMLLVKQVYVLSTSFPENENYGLKPQIQRAAVSVPSNIAEGWGRGYSQNFIQFLNVASGSLAELETQLIIGKDLGYIQENKEIMNLCSEVGKVLFSLKRNIQSKKESASL